MPEPCELRRKHHRARERVVHGDGLATERGHRERSRTDLALVAGITVFLLAWFLRTTLVRGLRFGVGPDFPVYLWWTRIGAASGLSMIGRRPGTPALLAVLQGTYHLPLVATVAGLQYALGAAAGLAAIALVRGRTPGGRWGWGLAGAFAGMFAVHLAGGYLSNLVLAVAFIATGAAIAVGTRRGTIAAAALFGGGGLAHPEFFGLSAAILAMAGVWAWVRTREPGGRAEAARVAWTLAGGITIVGAGLVSMLVGPSVLRVDTSKDAFLRRVGMRQELVRDYADRFRQKARLYAPVSQVFLALPGSTRVSGSTRRFLLTWVLASLVAVPVGLVTGLYPPERILTFGFAFPILAGLGIMWVWERLQPRRWLGLLAALALVAVIGWIWYGAASQQRTFETAEEVAQLDTAARIASTLPAGTPLVYVVDDPDATAIFLATHAENMILATLPPDRIGDAHVYIGTSENFRARVPTIRDSLQYDTLSRDLLSQIPTGPSAIFVVRELNKVPAVITDPALYRWDDGLTSSVPDPRPLPPLPDELRASSSAGIAFATIATVILLLVIGLGWSTWALGEGVSAVAAAPAFGAAMLVLVGIAAERLGVPLTGTWGPTAISAATGGGGYILFLAFKRTTLAEPAP
ncbi:MAG: hypothetical protein M3P11_04985 [Actinomycetota bacterium]|nr:hypothetical protein [Actinomycetota bacterium]